MNLKHLFIKRPASLLINGAIYSSISVALITPISSQADILNLGSQPRIAMKADAPKAGMSMNAVLLKFGEPQQRRTAPGKITKHNPRISTWNYANSTVYFENSHVIHTVVHR